MIAGEEEPLLVKEHHVATGVSRGWNCYKILIKPDVLLALDNALNTNAPGAVVLMHDAFAAKLPGK